MSLRVLVTGGRIFGNVAKAERELAASEAPSTPWNTSELALEHDAHRLEQLDLDNAPGGLQAGAREEVARMIDNAAAQS